MKSPLAARFARRSRSTLAAASTASLLLAGAGGANAININYIGGTTGVWSNTAVWNPAQVPGAADIATFMGTASQTVSLGGNQAAMGLSLTSTAFTAVRGSAASQVLSLGASGIAFGSAQTDLGGGVGQNIVVSLMADQSWTGSSTGGLIQLNSGVGTATQSITNGTTGMVTLTFDGVSTGGKTIYGSIDDGVLGGTTALAINTTGAFGGLALLGANTYSGGTTVTQGFLDLRNASALGQGPLTFANNALVKQVSSGLLGGLTAAGGTTLNGNPINLNGSVTFGGSQSIDFGTGDVTLGSATTLLFNGNTNPVTFTLGGNILGANNLTIGATGTFTNSLLNLNGTNTGNSAANPITILNQTVRFGPNALPTGNGSIVLNGGSIAVGAGSAYTTVASIIADARVTKTSGAFALLGDSSENVTFAASSGQLSLGASLGSVVRYTGTLTPNLNAYNVGGGGGTIVFNNTNAFTGARTFGTAGSNFSSQGGGGTVVINGLNNFDGAVGFGLGTLEVNSIGSVGGGPSALGAPTTAANGTISFGFGSTQYPGFLRYTGAGETTNRTLSFNSFNGSSSGFDASGTGAINFAGTFTQSSNSGNRFITLRGINTGANTMAGSLGITGTAGGLNLTKQHRGNWTLTNTNNFAGTNAATSGLVVNGGTLTGDYSNGAVSVLGNTATNLTLGGGTLAMVNNTAATVATQSIGNSATPNVILTANTGQSNVNVTGNGTAGSAVLTMGNTFTRNGGAFLNFNLLAGGQVTSSPAVTNSVVVGTGTVAAFTVTDAAGGDFATVTGGQIAKLNAATALPTAAGSATTNYVLTGSQTQTAPTAISTLRIAPTAAGGTLALGANNGFTSGLSAVSILKDGANAYTITGTTSLTASALVLSNFGTGALTVSVPATTGTNTLTKTGPGLVDLTAANVYTGTTSIFGGVLRFSNATQGTGNIVLNTGGILSIGADLNGATAGDFSRQVGTGTGQIQWANGDGGFSAFGGTRAVALTNNFGTATGQLVWGSTGPNNTTVAPNASPAFVKDGFALLLSSTTSDSTLDFQNPIDFVNVPRTVEVGNGTAAVDAVLSGVLSSSDYSGGLYKTGAGTLAITGANTYTGQTSILAGTLQVGNGGASGNLGTGAVVNNATLAFNRTGTLAVANVISGTGNVTQAGTGTTNLTAANTYAGGTTVTAGLLLVNNVTGSGTGTGAVTVTGGSLGGGNGAASLGILNTLGTGANTATSATYVSGILGVISGPVTISSGGTLAPGNSVGTLTVSTLTLASGSLANYEFNIGSTRTNDFTAVTGVLTLNGGTFSLFQEGTATPLTTPGTYNLFSYGTLAGTGVSALTVTNGVTGSYTYTFRNDVADNLIQLSVVAVPEPSTYALLGLGLGGLGLAAARRRRNALAA